MPSSSTRLAAALVLLCAPVLASAQTPTTIVYRLTPSADAPPAVDPKPLVDLGESGAAAELFNRISVVRRTSSGRIIVANRVAPELRVFDASGKYIRTIGTKGQGPGEYQDIDDVIVRRGDSLVVLDNWQRRFTVLGPDGAVVSTMGFQQPFATRPYNVTINSFDDGTILIGYGLVTSTKPSPIPVAVSVIVGRYTTAGVRLDSIGPFFTGENFHQVGPASSGGFAFWDRTWGRKGAIIATGNTFVAGDASAMEVRRYSAKGALLEVHRVDIPRTAITPEVIARFKAASLAQSDREVDKKRVEEMPYPAQFPSYHRFLIDARGRIWLNEYQYPPQYNRWLVLDPKTRLAKAVRLANGFVPFEISATEVTGVWKDADGVEHVRVYKLVE